MSTHPAVQTCRCYENRNKTPVSGVRSFRGCGLCAACDSLMTEDGSLPIIFEFFLSLRNPFVVSTCEDISDDNEVYFPKAQKTSWII